MEINFYKKGFNPVRYCGVAMLVMLFFMSTIAQGQLNGNYTIDQTIAASATNFQNYTSAVQALRGLTRSDGGPSLGTGVNGAVTITVATGTGPYTEQVVVPAITGASSTNTITFEGNGELLQFSPSSTNTAVVKIDGGDYLRFRNINVKPTHSTYARGFWVLNGANYNIIEDCNIDITSSTSTSTGYSCGIALVGSATSFTAYTTGGTKGTYNIFRNNEIYGSTSNNGLYAGIVLNGASSVADHNTLLEDNYIHNFYAYGVYIYYNMRNEILRGNTIIRGTKPSYTTFQAVYSYYSPGVKYYGNYIADDCPSNSITYTTYAIYEYYGTNTNTAPSEYINNTINLNSGYYRMGIYSQMYYASGKKFLHNTIYMRANQGYGYGIYSYMYDYSNLEFKNNIIDVSFNSYVSTFYNVYSYSYGPFIADGNVLPRNNNNYHYTGYAATATLGGTNALTFADWQNLPHAPDPNGTDIRPTYVDPVAHNMTPTLIDLDGFGVPAGVTTDQKGNARSLTNPDPGAIEFDIPINVTAYNFPTTICQGATNNVEVTITNSSALNLSGFYVNYKINGVLQASQQYTGTINAGASATFVFSLPVVSTNTGNYTLEAYVRGKAPQVTQAYTVNPAPVGSYLSKGSVFVGAFNSGDAIDPDIVAYGDNVRHKIEAPTGYTNNQFGSGWTFDFWEMLTAGGTSAGAQYSKTNPSGGNAAVNSFTPVMGQSDSTFLIRYALRSLSNGCVAPVVERLVFVAPRPVAAFTASAACDGDAVQFDNNTTLSSGTIEYLWNFGDGNTSVLINPAHTYASHGTYNVTLTATTNYGYSHVANLSVTVNQNPIAEFGHTNVCDGNLTPFADGSIIPSGTPTYAWNFGDGSAMGSGSNPTHQYTSPGTYEVTMTVTAAGCSDMASHYVTYAPMPLADFSPSATSCNSDEVSFTNGSGISSGKIGYSWDFGDQSFSTQTNPSHEYAIFGTIDVTLTVTSDFGCVDMITKQINLIESPKADFTTSMLCDKDNVNFSNATVEPASANTTYEWAFSDGSSYMTKDVSRSFPSVGSYTVTLKAFADNGCMNTVVKTISVDEEPVAEFYADDVCEGNDVVLMNASSGNAGNFTNAWDFGTAGTSTAKNPTVTLPVGTANITLTVTTPSGCESTVSKSVTVNPIPAATSLVVESGEKGDGTFVVSATVTPANANYVIFWGDGGRASGTASGGTINEIYTYL
ncbi:MAG TPA: hypothetical protein DIW47_04840, partial [Bacteroidetes bacterium]|nr:hypothetical protein [Bacteroidota bacterium]